MAHLSGLIYHRVSPIDIYGKTHRQPLTPPSGCSTSMRRRPAAAARASLIASVTGASRGTIGGAIGKVIGKWGFHGIYNFLKLIYDSVVGKDNSNVMWIKHPVFNCGAAQNPWVHHFLMRFWILNEDRYLGVNLSFPNTPNNHHTVGNPMVFALYPSKLKSLLFLANLPFLPVKSPITPLRSAKPVN